MSTGINIEIGANGTAAAREIRKVGSEITELDQMRAFCIAMSAGVTVIVASQLGLPVSSTHIAVGGVFGVGFLREYLKRRQAGALEFIKLHHAGADKAVVAEELYDYGRLPGPGDGATPFVERTNAAADPSQTESLGRHRAALDTMLAERTRPSAAKPLVAAAGGKDKKKGKQMKGTREPIPADD